VPTFFDFPQSGSQSRAIQYVIGEPVRCIALGMLEKMAIYLKRDGRIGMPEPMLNFGNRRPRGDHSGRAAMAKGVKSYPAKPGAGQGGVKRYSEEPISAYRLSFGVREN
jgi:hypothetical protein